MARDITDDTANTDKASPTTTDKVPVIDVSTTPDSLKESTLQQIMNVWTSLTAKTTLTGADQLTMVDSEASNVAKKITWTNVLAAIIGTVQTVTAAWTFGSAGAVGKLKIAGTTSGSTILDATAVASGTLTLPAATDTLVGKATTDILSNKSLLLTTGLADGAYSGVTVSGTAGATLAFGDLVYLAAADSRWELADANASATSGPLKLGICVLVAAADGSATTVLLFGNVRADAAFPAMTISAPVYVGTTAGDIQVAAPSGAADVIRVVGHANTADELFFNPSQDWFEHV